MELVTGKAGVPHVSSADDGRRIAGEVGAGSYILQTGGRLAPSLVDANTVRFATGDMIVQGRHIGITSPEDVKVASGSQGKKRMDYICVHYSRDVSGANPTLVENVEWTVLRGTPGTDATAPSVPSGSILDGDADVTVPICSVTFDGLTTGQPKLLIPELTPLATLGDSVSQLEKVDSFSGNGVNAQKAGAIVTLCAAASYNISDAWGSTTICTLPWRPRNVVSTAFAVQGGGSGVVLRVEKNGDVKVVGVNTTWRSGWLFGTLSFAVME